MDAYSQKCYAAICIQYKKAVTNSREKRDSLLSCIFSDIVEGDNDYKQNRKVEQSHHAYLITVVKVDHNMNSCLLAFVVVFISLFTGDIKLPAVAFRHHTSVGKLLSRNCSVSKKDNDNNEDKDEDKRRQLRQLQHRLDNGGRVPVRRADGRGRH